MTPNLSDLARRFRFNETLAGLLADGMDAADWSRQPSAHGGNTAHWILGHVAASRRFVLRKLGVDVPEEEWERLFAMRSRPEGSDAYPAPSVLLEELRASGERLEERLLAMSAAEAAEACGGKLPDGATTRAGAASFGFFHETYHLGQVGLLRRQCGKPGFA